MEENSIIKDKKDKMYDRYRLFVGSSYFIIHFLFS